MVLPIIPGLSSSSPVLDGKFSGFLDSRLNDYMGNSKKIPSVAGKIIPEVVKSKKEYEDLILNKMYLDIAPFDPEGVLQDEFLNARGAIARFGRGSIEIRVIDIQECVRSDIAIVQGIVNLLKFLVGHVDIGLQESLSTEDLHDVFVDCVKFGENSIIKNKAFLSCFNFAGSECRVKDLWKHIVDLSFSDLEKKGDQYFVLNHIFDNGTLASRLLKNLGSDYSKENIKKVYLKLNSCLVNNELF